MKRILTTLALAALSTGAMAQYNTRVQLQLGNFATPNAQYDRYLYSSVINNYGASVQHSVCKHYSIKLSYQRWASPLDGDLGSYYDHNKPYMSFTHFYRVTPEQGELQYRANYNVLELSPVYSMRRGRHEAYGSVGPSVAWGIDGILQRAPYPFDLFVGTGPEVWYEPSPERKVYVGGVAEAGYNYRMGRISTGLSGAYRFYGKDFTTINLQLNIGYNFNSFNLHR